MPPAVCWLCWPSLRGTCCIDTKEKWGVVKAAPPCFLQKSSLSFCCNHMPSSKPGCLRPPFFLSGKLHSAPSFLFSETNPLRWASFRWDSERKRPLIRDDHFRVSTAFSLAAAARFRKSCRKDDTLSRSRPRSALPGSVSKLYRKKRRGNSILLLHSPFLFIIYFSSGVSVSGASGSAWLSSSPRSNSSVSPHWGHWMEPFSRVSSSKLISSPQTGQVAS